MAKAPTSSSITAWPQEGYRLDVACQQIVPALWQAYAEARAAAGPVLQLLIFPAPADQQRRHDAYWTARRRLEAELRRLVERGELQLWARRDALAEPQRVAMLPTLKIDFEKQIARDGSSTFV